MKILTVALGVTPPIAFAAHNPFYAQAQTPETVLHEFYKTPFDNGDSVRWREDRFKKGSVPHAI